MSTQFYKFFLSLVLGLSATAGLAAFSSAAESESITYKLTDFEENTLPFRAGFSGGADATISIETGEAHGGKQSAAITWDGHDDKNLTNPWVRSNYLFIGVFKLLGDPEQLTFWVKATPEMVGTSVGICVDDGTGETFTGSAKVTKAGWNQLTIKMTDLVSKDPTNGNHDRKLDLPLKFFGFVGGEIGSKGNLLVDDFEVTTRGNPRNLTETNLTPVQKGYIAWGTVPSFRFDVTNRSSGEVKNVEANLTIVDTLTTKTVFEKKVEVPLVPGKTTKSFPLSFDIPNGTYDVKWEVRDAEGPLPGNQDKSPVMRITRMAGDASGEGKGKAENRYVTNWGLVGGVFWETPRDVARKTGASWERLGAYTSWGLLEKKPGEINPKLAADSVTKVSGMGLGIVWLNTFDSNLPLYKPQDESFARKFGLLHLSEAKAFGDKVEYWEFGNEDNGALKFLYTEVARNAAAAVRSVYPSAMLATSGVASVDVGFMRMQDNRGLFDRLDMLSTHPYTWSSSPEAYGLLKQYGQVDEVIDDLGGMKIQLTTEFGYSEKGDQLKRAQWIPRNYALAAAGGLYRHGLYAFNNEFGIYNYGGTDAYPAAVSLNNYALRTFAHRFVGWLQQDDHAWAGVYEKAGKPLIMAWVLQGTGELNLAVPAGTKPPEIVDIFGNPVALPAPGADATHLEIPLSESPIYISGASTEVLAPAAAEASKRARARYLHCLAASGLAQEAVWKSLGEGDLPKAEALQNALLAWKPSAAPIPKTEQAVIAQTLRWLNAATYAEAVVRSGKIEKLPMESVTTKWQKVLKESVADDVDLPALRWLLHTWEEITDTEAMASEVGNSAYAQRLATLEPVYEDLAGKLAQSGPKIFFPIWPYLHASPGNEKLNERFVFVPGKAVPAKVRLQSYSSKTYETELSFELPPGWKAYPETWKGKISAGEMKEMEVAFTAGTEGGAKKNIVAVLNIPGKPTVRIPYDDFTLLPPLEISLPVLSKMLPGAPLPVRVTNHGEIPLGAKVRLVKTADTPPLAVFEIEKIPGGESRDVMVSLPPNLAVPPLNDWKFVAEVSTTDGKNFQVPLAVDFDVAVQAKSPPKIDGDLSDWSDAAPLHLDQEIYTQNSFPSGWSKEDLSAVAYTKWDDKNFYFAAHVIDQTFQQALSGGDVWAQDSVQFFLMGADGKRHQFALAMTPKGPEIWCDSRSVPVTDGQIKVLVSPGQVIYEAAIPWSDLPDLKKPAIGDEFTFDVLVNDDDAIVKRRYVERYGINIVNCTGPAGLLRLGGTSTETAAESKESDHTIFLEDFEQYADGSVPDTWAVIGISNPRLQTVVRAGKGVDGGKGLEIFHPDTRSSNTYVDLSRPITRLVAGKKYRLSFKVKGMGKADGPIEAVATCLDLTGNAGYNWSAHWTPSDQWQDVSIEWTHSGGDLRMLLRNETIQTDSMVFDDLRVTEIP